MPEIKKSRNLNIIRGCPTNWDNLILILQQKYSKRVILRVRLYLQLSRDAKRYRAQQRAEKRHDIGTEALILTVGVGSLT